MKNGLFILAVIGVIIAITYNPAVKTLTGEVQHVEANEIQIDCPQQKPRFKPSDDIGYFCTIVLNEDTIVEPNEKIRQGQTIAVELVRKTKITTESPAFLAAKIKIVTNE